MIEFLIIRHGQSVADIEGRHEGRADFPLTDLGRDQAHRAGEWIAARYKLDRLIASPLQRAAGTAQIIAGYTGNTIEYHPLLMERDNGDLAGLTFAEAAEKYPLPPGGRKFFERYPGGESILEFQARVAYAWWNLCASTVGNERIGIVAHGGTISMLYRSFLSLSLDRDVWLSTGDTGIHLWRMDGSRRQLVFANSLAHLHSHE